ncbi:2-succinylbenzoate-CoA ligase, partial [Listeria monocytogenes]|uniref:AMP-binding enzyme n=1 Tax=Listeria monocytogenes TaxID=1639 RepID=UPI000D96B7AC
SEKEGVNEVAVFGKPDVKWGSVPVAFLVEVESFVDAELRLICESNLAGYIIPKHITFVELLAKSASG